MAKYKNGFKRKSNYSFLNKTMIGFGVTFILIVISMIVFSFLNPGINGASDITNMKEEHYLVYYYSDLCSACIVIKDQVADFADNNNADIKLYYFDAAKLSQSDIGIMVNTYGVNSTPTLLTVVNGVVVDINVGTDEIPAAFAAINSGTYSPIN